MRVAIQENLLPAHDLRSRLALAAELGYSGIEARGPWLRGNEAAYRTAAADAGLTVPTICGGIEGCLLDPDPAERQRARESIVHLLRAGDAIGGAAVIVVPIFGPARLPDLSPWHSAPDLELAVLVPLLRQVADEAAQEGLSNKLLIEPLNRYETHLINRVEQAVAVAEAVASPHVGVMADLFHMQIEERSFRAVFEEFGPRLDHLHLADSNRKLPGQGQLDFGALAALLRDSGFRGTVAIESGILGDAITAVRQAADLLAALG